MKRFLIPASAALVLALTACGSGPEPEQPAVSAVEQADTVPEGTVSVERYAGEIAALQVDLDEWFADWEETGCSLMSSQEDLICSTYAMTGALTAEAVGTSVRTLSNEDAPGFVGHPPAEVADLYAETLESADAADAAGEAYNELECPEDDECLSATVTVIRALEDLDSEFTKWSPYI